MPNRLAEPEPQVSVPEHELNLKGAWPVTVSEERTTYSINRHCEVRCRLWYEVTPMSEGLLRYFLVGIQELD